MAAGVAAWRWWRLCGGSLAAVAAAEGLHCRPGLVVVAAATAEAWPQWQRGNGDFPRVDIGRHMDFTQK
jgi:hypothetical protein